MKNKKKTKKQKKLEKATLHIISQGPPSLRQKELKEKKWMDSQQNSTTAAVWMYRADGWPSIRLYTCSTRSSTASLSNPPHAE